MTVSAFLLVFVLAFPIQLVYVSVLARREYAVALKYESSVSSNVTYYHSSRHILHELASRAGLPKPLLVFKEDVSEGLSIRIISYTKRRCFIEVSAPLARLFSEEEWRGAFGHELGHIRRGIFFTDSFFWAQSVWFSTRVAIATATVILGLRIISAALGGAMGFLDFLQCFVAWSLCSRVTLFAVDCPYFFYTRRGEFAADRFSVELTAEKAGLLAILYLIEKEDEKRRRALVSFELELLERYGICCAWLYRCALFLRSLLATHPDTRERIRRIKLLSADGHLADK